jgi:Zc3h12a-like Ribonuclease NYN domain
MSARPRLVQEGRPLTENVEAKDYGYGHDHGHDRYSHARTSRTDTSLTAAAGGRHKPPVKQRSKQSMRLVIGADEDELMEDDSEEKHAAGGSHQHDQSHKHRQPRWSSSNTHHTAIQTRLVVGGDEAPLERMEGVESLDAKGPLVVVDGANIAYAYADAMHNNKEPNSRGIQIAANYFLSVGVRVTIVIPAPWFRAKPRADHSNSALMVTDQLQVLQDLKARGLLVASPPRDDDDAYALTIARREQVRATQRGEGGGFVLSNDMFRDAVARDASLEEWLKQGRVSYAFVDMGNLDDHGDVVLDFIPNPRHALVTWTEEQHRSIHANGH